MISEPGHPTRSDWHAFRKDCSPFYFSEVIGREEAKIPDWLLPFARGCVVLSYNLLLKAQYRSESGDINGAATVRYFPSGFSAPRFGSFWFLFRDGFPEEVLVFRFGSTPVAIRDYESAMRFIWYYRQNAFPGCLAWVRTMPLNCTAAIALARERRANEAEPSLPRAF